MYDKIYNLVVDKFVDDRDDFWLEVDKLSEQQYEDFKSVEEEIEKLLKRTKELQELEDVMDFLHSKIYR